MKTLDSAQAADFLGLSVNTLLDLARKGTFPGKNWGNRWTFFQEHLEAWLLGEMQREQEERIIQAQIAAETGTRPPPRRGPHGRRKELIQ